MSSVTIAPEKEKQREGSSDEPYYHIEAYPGSPFALCGWKFRSNVKVPWHRGPLDCQECWRINDELEAMGM